MKRRGIEKSIVLVVFLLLEVGLIAAMFLSGRHTLFESQYGRPMMGLIAGLLVALYFLYVQHRARSLQQYVIGEKVKTQTLIEALPDAVVVLDAENVVVALNSMALETLASDASDCVAAPLAKHFDAETAQRLEADFFGVLDATLAGPKTPLKVRVNPVLVDATHRIGKVVLLEKVQRGQAPPVAASATGELGAMASAVKVAQGGLADVSAGLAKADEAARNSLARALFVLEKVRFFFQDSSGELAGAQSEPVDFKRACEAAVGRFEPLAKLKSVQVKTEVPAQNYNVKGNGKALERALSEILLNAFSYTPANGTISLRLQASDTHVRASILDTGIGIDRAELMKVFDRGFRGSIQTPEASVGRGAGLTIARGIIEAHKGSVVIESERGRGTMVTIVMPR
ncbi:MAG: ATP-binding protein [Planctomycetota bacterium]|nr:ATP-binding protein [Planctomycetota bacterium]